MLVSLLASTVALFAVQKEPPKQGEIEPFRYAASISFFEKRCQFHTGDVIFNAAGFRNDLRNRFDTALGITIYHKSEVPNKCVVLARKSAKRAGFKDVRTTSREIDLSLR
jgi:hypothetical protein